MVESPYDDDEFKDIRPYRDHEIREVLDRVRKDPWILSALRRFFWPNTPEWIVPPVERFLQFYLRLRLVGIHTVDDWHRRFIQKTVLSWIAERTMTELTYSGTDYISREIASLFITNHRDIVLDSAFLAYGLMKLKLRSQEIAFGDNLLLNDFVSDLIRMNRGFIVKRNLALREQMPELLKLSKYIWTTLARGQSIWLAQRGGRAKDGDDRTAPAILKMVYMCQVKGGMNFSDYMNECNIVPAAISYEYDPCDRIKAREIYLTRSEGEYRKGHRDDLISILKGINEPKGRVHYSFCEPLKGNWSDPKQVAEEIDRRIIDAYHLWPSNFIAYDEIQDKPAYRDRYSAEEKEKFLYRFRRFPEEIRETALEIYARPLINKLDMHMNV